MKSGSIGGKDRTLDVQSKRIPRKKIRTNDVSASKNTLKPPPPQTILKKGGGFQKPPRYRISQKPRPPCCIIASKRASGIVLRVIHVLRVLVFCLHPCFCMHVLRYPRSICSFLPLLCFPRSQRVVSLPPNALLGSFCALATFCAFLFSASTPACGCTSCVIRAPYVIFCLCCVFLVPNMLYHYLRSRFWDRFACYPRSVRSCFLPPPLLLYARLALSAFHMFFSAFAVFSSFPACCMVASKRAFGIVLRVIHVLCVLVFCLHPCLWMHVLRYPRSVCSFLPLL